MTKNNLTLPLAVIAVVLSLVAVYRTWPAAPSFGAATTAGNLLAENYIPYILYNGGYSSDKDIETSANLNAAKGTFSGTLEVTGATTLTAAATLTTSGSIATTSTTRMLNIGAGASATTTIDIGKPCFLVAETNKTPVYYWPQSLGTLGGWATSTVSCF